MDQMDPENPKTMRYYVHYDARKTGMGTRQFPAQTNTSGL